MTSLLSPSSPSRNTAATSPVSSPKGRYHNSDEDCSVVSRSSSSASSSSEFIQLSSPSSSFGGTPKKIKNLSFQHEAMATTKSSSLAETKQLLLPGKAHKALHRWYGNADFSDRIGRTLSFFLIARLALSFLLATILDEE